jgi:hypothetical protein
VRLSDIKTKFFALRGNCKIVVRNHAYKAQPNRGFTNLEILNLVKFGRGQVKENGYPSAINGSFLFCPLDDQKEICELVLVIGELEVEADSSSTKEMIIVCSAYRKDRL